LDAAKWYSITRKDVTDAQGGKSILRRYHNNSHIKALIELYPEVMWEKEKFSHHADKWQDPKKRRDFFDAFSKSRQFNPLDSEKWYSISLREVKKAGGAGLLRYYKGSHITALLDLYPELMLQRKEFLNFPDKWQNPKIRRKFLDDFASIRQFDPLDAEQWYSITHNEIKRAGGSALLYYYNGSPFKALKELYPELMLKKSNFHKSKVSKG